MEILSTLCYPNQEEILADQAGMTEAVVREYRAGKLQASLDYAEFYREVESYCCCIRNRYPAGDILLLIIGRLSLQILILVIAALRSGSRVCITAPEHPAEGLEEIINQQHPDLFFIESGDMEKFLAVLPPACVVLKGGMSLRAWVRSGTGSEMFSRSGADGMQFMPFQSSRAALLIYTSGSSGNSKGICYSYTALENFLERHDFLYRQFPDQTSRQTFCSDLVATLGLYHFGGLCFCLQALIMRRPLHLLSDFSVEGYWHLVQTNDVRLLQLVPAMYELLLKLPHHQTSRHNVKYCLAMGEAMTETLAKGLQERFGVRVCSTYGLSECQTGIGHSMNTLLGDKVPIDSIGRHLWGEIRLLSDTEDPATGELWVRNSTVFPCYLDAAENTARLENGWFRTGDILSRDQDGFFYVRGRKDQMLHINGRNIYPAAVESIVNRHPRIDRAVAVGFRDRFGKKSLGILVQADPKMKLQASELMDWLWRKEKSVPALSWLCNCKTLPRLGNGKLDRKKCQSLVQNEYWKRFPVSAGGCRYEQHSANT